ncbi:multidrug effflux MFS transporter [Parendozoicomonas sp. Alg238-R29]|uniref:multidrug effflux MFS transporter n=1 Tax=Parendozoicomonas sp. Alg238-R29 TaxID=2993446 RepID=UPI00248D946B|nr:multidrug effflux MFS transporter [Parendozoicomonas sp. Alg238-R29]
MPVTQRSALPVIFALVILSPLAIDMYLPSLPEMSRVFKADEAGMQLTISLFMICMGVGQLFAGPVSDRFGRRASALLGTGLYVVGSLMGAMSETLSVLYVSRVLQGVGAASCAVSAFAWVRDHFDARESGKWISYMGGMIGTIPTLAPTLGGVLAVQWNWSANFVFMGLLGGAVFIAAMIFMEKGRSIHTTPSKSAESDGNNLKEVLTHRQFLTYSLTGTLTMGGILAYATNAPFVAMNLAGLDEFGFAMMFGMLGVLQLLSSIAAPHLAGRIGRRQTIIFGSVLSLVGAASMLVIPANEPLWYFAMAALGCVGFNLIYGTASGLTLEHFKHCSGLAAAIDGCARMAGGGLIASLLKLTGLSVFGVVSLAYGLLIIPLLLAMWDLASRKKAAPEDVPYQEAA